MKAILHLTKNCNLRCRYCYAPDKVTEDMPVAIAKKGINLAIANGNGSACVSYFGGEPMMRYSAIKELTEYAAEVGHEKGVSMHYRMSTNGTLFTEESLDFCRRHNILFAISIDGNEEAHNTQRRTAAGTGSWKMIDDKLDMILAYNPHTVVTSVITPPTVNRLYESAEYLWGRGIRYIVHQLDYTHPDWTTETFEDLASSYKQLGQFYLEKMRNGESFHMALFDDKLKTHTLSPFVLGGVCDFGKRKVSIAHDGKIFPCVQFISNRPDAAEYCIGHVDTGFTEHRQTLIARNKSGRPQCEDCVHIGRCANYCGCVNWQLTGEVTKVPAILCAHERMLIPIADEVGNELWDERNSHFLKKHYKEYADRFIYKID